MTCQEVEMMETCDSREKVSGDISASQVNDGYLGGATRVPTR